MKHLLLAGALSLATITSAHATTWYLLNFSTLVCRVETVPELVSPRAFEMALRREGKFGGTRVYRDDNGDINSVGITNGDVHMTLLYFPTLARCKMFIEQGLADGFLTNPNELK